MYATTINNKRTEVRVVERPCTAVLATNTREVEGDAQPLGGRASNRGSGKAQAFHAGTRYETLDHNLKMTPTDCFKDVLKLSGSAVEREKKTGFINSPR